MSSNCDQGTVLLSFIEIQRYNKIRREGEQRERGGGERITVTGREDEETERKGGRGRANVRKSKCDKEHVLQPQRQ